jgi:D-3-phosphoglycerate dehydrogenase
MPTPRLLIAEPKDFSPRAESLLRDQMRVDKRQLYQHELESAFMEYDAIWIRLGLKIDKKAVPECAPRCRFIVVPATGLDHLDLRTLESLGVKVLSLASESEFLKEVRATAEHTLALTMLLMRRLHHSILSVKRGEWDRESFIGSELYKKKVGIIGLGRLGTIVADYFYALGCRVFAFDPYVSESSSHVTLVDELPNMLESVDIVSVHVKLNDETANMLAEDELSCLKPHAVLINTSRGGLLDEQALLRALQNESLAGAALDVLFGEPPDVGNPLVEYSRENSNLIITPHLGGNTYESFEKTEVFMAQKLLLALHESSSS